MSDKKEGLVFINELEILGSAVVCFDNENKSPFKGHKLSRHGLSRSMPENLMIGVNAEHDFVISQREAEIRSQRYPDSPDLPPPEKFTKAQSSPARLGRTRSADVLSFRSADLKIFQPKIYDIEQVV